MFARTLVRLGISPYTVFLKRYAKSPEFQGLTFGDRARRLAEKWSGLKRKERLAIQKAAKAEKSCTKGRRILQESEEALPTARGLSDYQAFVKRYYSRQSGSPKMRIKRLAKKWNARRV